jgi:hypothetical protein
MNFWRNSSNWNNCDQRLLPGFMMIFLVFCSLIYFSTIAFVYGDTKVVVLMPYNGEKIVKLHIDSIYDLVDLFVIVESKLTFSGHVRKEYFSDVHQHFFAPIAKDNKLLKLKIESFPFENSNSEQSSDVNWKREIYHRDFGQAGVLKHMANQSYILISGDADEITNRSAIATALSMYNSLSTQHVHLLMLNQVYSFKWVKDECTDRAIITNDVYIRNHFHPSLLHELRRARIIEKDGKKVNVISGGGWHCSYCMTAERILEKLEATSHNLDAQVNRPEIKNLTWINHAAQNGIDVLNRPYEWEVEYKYRGEYGYPSCPTCKTQIEHFQDMYPPEVSDKARGIETLKKKSQHTCLL